MLCRKYFHVLIILYFCLLPLDTQFFLTDDGEDDDHEVEDVPADGEEVAAQRYNLDEALEGEDDDEGQVDVVQDVLHLRGLLVRLHHHGDHVEEDQHHDDDVEGLLPRQVEEEALHRVLHRKTDSLAFSFKYIFLMHHWLRQAFILNFL